MLLWSSGGWGRSRGKARGQPQRCPRGSGPLAGLPYSQQPRSQPGSQAAQARPVGPKKAHLLPATAAWGIGPGLANNLDLAKQ